MKIKLNYKTAIKKVIKEVIYFLFFPVLILINIIIKIFMKVKGCKNINIVYISYDRIGHLATDTELFLRSNLISKEKQLNFLVGWNKQGVANKQLANMIKRKIKVVENRFLNNLISFLYRNMKVLRKCEPYHNDDYEVWDKYPPQLSFTIEEEKKGKELLREINIDPNAKFICFHNRDNAYLEKKDRLFGQKIDRFYHNYRDCSINNYLMAVEFLARKGMYAIRMGEIVKDKLVINNSKIIDYASHHRSDFGDIYLPAKCKFFLGSTAGLSLVPTIFNIPIARANYIPIGYPPLSARDIFIPKKLWLTTDKRFLTFREIIEMGAHEWLETQNYLDNGIEVIENTPVEILELAKEMDSRIDDRWVETDEDIELQTKYRQLFTPGIHGYGSKSRIGSKFLRDNRNLLE